MSKLESNRRSFLRVLGIGAGAAAVAVPAVAAAAETDPSFDLRRNPFDIPHALVPHGMKYEWKRIFVNSEVPDSQHFATMLMLGWSPVPLARHKDHFKDRGFHSWIEVGGLVLMEKKLNQDPAAERMRADRAMTHDVNTRRHI